MSAVDAFLACLEAAVGGDYCTPPREPRCTDCSGLVARCYRQASGREISGDSHAQATLGREITHSLQPGDVLLFDTQGGREVRLGNAISHVGVYIGGDRMINALNEDAGIVQSDLDTPYWRPLKRGARRLIDEDAPDPKAPTPDPTSQKDPAEQYPQRNRHERRAARRQARRERRTQP